MRAQNLDFPAGHAQPADVRTPQVGNLVGPSYHSERLSDMVATGRAKSAVNSEQVQDAGKASEAPLEGWSRGWHVSFWFWQWSRLSPPAPRKKKPRWNRSPRKSWIPASTSNLAARACRHQPDGPAPIPGLLRASAVCRPEPPDIASGSLRSITALGRLCSVRAVGCQHRRQGPC